MECKPPLSKHNKHPVLTKSKLTDWAMGIGVYDKTQLLTSNSETNILIQQHCLGAVDPPNMESGDAISLVEQSSDPQSDYGSQVRAIWIFRCAITCCTTLAFGFVSGPQLLLTPFSFKPLHSIMGMCYHFHFLPCLPAGNHANGW